MRVTLIGPDEGHKTEHKIDAGSAVFLMNQLRLGSEPRTLFIDGEQQRVASAWLQFFTMGDEMVAHVTVTLAKDEANGEG